MWFTEKIRIYPTNEDLERGIGEYFISGCIFSLIVAKDSDPVRI